MAHTCNVSFWTRSELFAPLLSTAATGRFAQGKPPGGDLNSCWRRDYLARVACNTSSQGPYVYYWHAELGADGKDYRANFVHAPFPKILSSRVPGVSRPAAQVSALGSRALGPANSRLRRNAKPYQRDTVMTATFNPQAAADQARNAYRNVTAQLGLLALDTAIPEAVRALDEKTVSQTREAYDRSKDALEASITTFERSFDAAGWGAAAFNRKIIDIAQRNLNSCFDLAHSLAGAKNLAEIVELQAAHWRKQFDTLTSQAEEVRALSTKVKVS